MNKDEEKDQETGWVGDKVKCDLCSNEWIAVYHEDSEKLECPNCGNMANYERLGLEDKE